VSRAPMRGALMRKFFGISAIFLIALTSGAFADAPTKTYAELVAQAESGDPATDYTALRMAFVASDQYDGYMSDRDDELKPAWDASQAKDCAGAIAASDKVVKKYFMVTLLHMMRQRCYRELGNTEAADREFAIAKGLLDSVLKSGDGKSPETAYVVVTMSEENLVEGWFDLDQQRQSLINKGGHNYDLIEGPNHKTGEHMAIYFNVDAMFGSLLKKFGAKREGAQN